MAAARGNPRRNTLKAARQTVQIDWIGFDADDTLWVNERLYREARKEFEGLLAPYAVDLEAANRRVDQIEVANLEWYGYGAMSFGLSLIEAAVELTQGKISGQHIAQVIALTKRMLSAEVELLEGAEQTLAELAQGHPLLLITKGEPIHQHSKIERSGLRQHFRSVEIVVDKTPATYAAILERHAIRPAGFLMVGNSLKSDILPVVSLGGWAVHIPSELTWEHEVAEIPADLRSRVFELGGLAELPAWLRVRAEEAAGQAGDATARAADATARAGDVTARPAALAAEIAAAMQELPTQSTPAMRVVRRAYSQQIQAWEPGRVLELADELIRRPGLRWIGYELIRFHPAAFRSLGPEQLEQLGQGIDSWEATDTFARALAGPAWLRGQIPDALIYDWAHSPDLWWRRAALVSTVALNAKVDKGPGDVPRTLRVCRLLVDDPEDMVVKALSWALRELVRHDPVALEAFLQEHDRELAARVKREVRTKLRTGLKNPRRARAKVRTRPRAESNRPDRVKL